MKRIDLPSDNDDSETFLDKFSRLYWKETASDVAFIAPLLPGLFEEAGVNYRDVVADFQESLTQEECSPEQDKAWMMMTGAVNKLITNTGTMMLFEGNEKERLLYVLRICAFITEGFEAGEAWNEHNERVAATSARPKN